MNKRRISIIGVGGGACKIVDCVSEAVREGTQVVAVNTDQRALEASRATTKLQIGLTLTNGLGCGGDPEKGKQSAKDDIDLLNELFSNVDLAIVVVCLGGGTGTGAAPQILKVARESGALTLCFAALPFSFEGGQKEGMSHKAIENLRKNADAVIVVPNDRLSEYVGQTSVVEAFEKVNSILAIGIYSISKLVTEPGVINLDFANLKEMVCGSEGVCTFGYGDAQGDGKALDITDQLLTHPLLEGGEVLSKAGSVLVSIIGGPDLSFKDIESIMAGISSKVRGDCNVAMGTVVDDNWTDRMTVTAIVSEKWAVQEPFGFMEPEEPVLAQEPVVESLPEEFIEPQIPAEPELPQKPAKPRRRKRKSEKMQEKLNLGADKGSRFRNVEPTVLDGEDLDIPTYKRRGIKIDQ